MTAGMMAISRVISRRSHGRRRRLMNPSITIWPASVPVSVAFWPEQSSATANSVLAIVVPSSGDEQLVRVPDVGDVLVPVPWNVAAAMMRIARVDEEREHQRDRRIDRREPDRFALALVRVAVLPRLHDRRVQVQVVRHHGRAEDADGDVEHLRVPEDLRRRDEPADDARRGPASPARARRRTSRRSGESGRRRALRRSGSPCFCRNRTMSTSRAVRQTPQIERQPEEQVQRDRRADDFGQVARGNGDLAQEPEDQRRPAARRCRGRPAPGRGRWRCRGAPRAPAAGSPSGWRS